MERVIMWGFIFSGLLLIGYLAFIYWLVEE